MAQLQRCQSYCIVHNDQSCRAIAAHQKLCQGRGFIQGHGDAVQHVFLRHIQPVLHHGQAEACVALVGEYLGDVVADEGNALVPQGNQVVGGLLACHQIVVIYIYGVIDIGAGLADDHEGDFLFVHVGNQRVLQGGVEEDEALHPLPGGQLLHIFQHLLVGFPGNHDGGVVLLHGLLADATDGTGDEGVVVALLCLGAHDDADCLGLAGAVPAAGRTCFRVCCTRAGGGDLIAQLGDCLPYLLPGFCADGGIVVAGSGYRCRGNSCQSRYIADCYCHK